MRTIVVCRQKENAFSLTRSRTAVIVLSIEKVTINIARCSIVDNSIYRVITHIYIYIEGGRKECICAYIYVHFYIYIYTRHVLRDTTSYMYLVINLYYLRHCKCEISIRDSQYSSEIYRSRKRRRVTLLRTFNARERYIQDRVARDSLCEIRDVILCLLPFQQKWIILARPRLERIQLMFLSSVRSVRLIGQVDLHECTLIIAMKRFIQIQAEKT